MPHTWEVALATAAQDLDVGLLRSMLDRATVGFAVFHPVDDGSDFVAVYVNDAFQGFKPDAQMVGRRFSEILPESAELVLPVIREVLETGQMWFARNRRNEYEKRPGEPYVGYFTYSIRRVQLAGGPAIVTELEETTDEIEAEQQATRELEISHLLLRTSRALAEHVELPRVLTELAEVVLSSTSHARSFVFTWNERSQCLTYAAAAGRDAFASNQTFAFAELSDVTKQAIRERRTALADFDALSETARGRALSAQRSHLLLDVPVVWRDRLVALIGVDDPGERREFTPREIEIVEGIGAQAATAIENARLFEEREETLRSLAQKDREIRRAYSDVIGAVTGGRMIILGKDELGEVSRESHGEQREIRDPADLSEARRYLRERLGDLPCLPDLLLAFSEGTTNMLKHAGGGTYRLDADARRVQLVLSDHGSGIDFRDLPKVTLISGYSTKQTLGMGFTLMMELTDRLFLSTDREGTTIVLERDRGEGSRC